MKELIDAGIDWEDIVSVEQGRIVELAYRIGQSVRNSLLEHSVIVDGREYQYSLHGIPGCDNVPLNISLGVTFSILSSGIMRKDEYSLTEPARGEEGTILRVRHQPYANDSDGSLEEDIATIAMGTHIATLWEDVKPRAAHPPVDPRMQRGED